MKIFKQKLGPSVSNDGFLNAPERLSWSIAEPSWVDIMANHWCNIRYFFKLLPHRLRLLGKFAKMLLSYYRYDHSHIYDAMKIMVDDLAEQHMPHNLPKIALEGVLISLEGPDTRKNRKALLELSSRLQRASETGSMGDKDERRRFGHLCKKIEGFWI